MLKYHEKTKTYKITYRYVKKITAHCKTYHCAPNEIHHYCFALQGPRGYCIIANYHAFLPISVIKLFYTEK